MIQAEGRSNKIHHKCKRNGFVRNPKEEKRTSVNLRDKLKNTEKELIVCIHILRSMETISMISLT